jgi:hypothetical protein
MPTTTTTGVATATDNQSPEGRGSERPLVYWHRQLPPLEAEAVDEHVLEASSGRVQSSLAHRDDLWDQCYRELMDNAESRLRQEIERLGGHYAHVLDESIDARRDDSTCEAWLQGRFTYVLYREPRQEGSGL